MAYRYILRYLIDPGFEEAERIEELASFCRESLVEEVMLFFAAEELSPGYPTADELTRFIALGRRLKTRLEQEGVALSLNPWATLNHSARGRTLREGQDFRRMVGENGVESHLSPCPLCPKWLDYLSDAFARMAREIRPTALWVEDDWRLRNHDGALGWGGCFCAEHLALFSRKVGEPVSREALLAAVLAPGPPHPWRALWLDLSRETLVEPLRTLARRIREAAPGTQIALMSGSPDTHAAEGRDWGALQKAVAGEGVFLSRPTLKPYTQTHALGVPPGMTRLTWANLHGEVEVYPELENSPRCGAYSKSRAFSSWQMLHTAAMGSAGITLNHYDMLGNGISLDPAFGTMLAAQKARLGALAELKMDDRLAEGVCVLFKPEISRHTHTAPGAGSFSALSQITTAWGDAAFILSMAHGYATELPQAGAPVWANQQTLRALDDTALARLLAGPLLLDATAAATVVERGFGREIGLERVVPQRLAETAYAYEEIVAERFVSPLPGPRKPRLSAQRCAPVFARLEPTPRAEVLSWVCNATHTRLWPGAVLFRNASGGVVATLACPVGEAAGQFFMGFFNVYRAAFLQALCFEMAPAAPQACVANAPMHVYRAPLKDGTLLAALNPTDDPLDQVVWKVEKGAFSGGSWFSLGSEGQWHPCHPDREEGPLWQTLAFKGPVAPLDGAFFRYQR